VTLKNYLFIHGGPGFNSYAEKALLTPAFTQAKASAEFWNEPSKLRLHGESFLPEQAFQNWCRSIEKKLDVYRKRNEKVHLLVHSFGINAVVRLIEANADVVTQLTLFAPTLNPYNTSKNVAKLGSKLHFGENPAKSRQIDEELSLTRTYFDSHLQTAMLLAAEHPLLFVNYWANHDILFKAADASKDPEAQFDLESFSAGLKDFSPLQPEPPRLLNIDIPVNAIFGAGDPVVDVDLERSLLQRTFKKLELHLFNESRHYPHLEETPALFKLLNS
jgi:pimeloyl-ACP methyl ester carboxylesterase